MKKVVIVNCFDTYEGRILLLREFFLKFAVLIKEKDLFLLNQNHIIKIFQSDV
jgi:hypothetical protein